MTSRLRLVLGKFPVTKVTSNFGTQTAELHLGGTTTATFSGLPQLVDLRVGDLLTLYTEVLTKGKTDA